MGCKHSTGGQWEINLRNTLRHGTCAHLISPSVTIRQTEIWSLWWYGADFKYLFFSHQENDEFLLKGNWKKTVFDVKSTWEEKRRNFITAEEDEEKAGEMEETKNRGKKRTSSLLLLLLSRSVWSMSFRSHFSNLLAVEAHQTCKFPMPKGEGEHKRMFLHKPQHKVVLLGGKLFSY